MSVNTAKLKKRFASEIKTCAGPLAATALGKKIAAYASAEGMKLTPEDKAEMREHIADSYLREAEMNFPMLQMLAESKKKKVVPDEMDFDAEGGDLGAAPSKSIGDKKRAPKGLKSNVDAAVIDKTAVLKFLKDCDAKCRRDVSNKLASMITSDEEELKEAIRGVMNNGSAFRKPESQEERDAVAAGLRTNRTGQRELANKRIAALQASDKRPGENTEQRSTRISRDAVGIRHGNRGLSSGNRNSTYRDGGVGATRE